MSSIDGIEDALDELAHVAHTVEGIVLSTPSHRSGRTDAAPARLTLKCTQADTLLQAS